MMRRKKRKKPNWQSSSVTARAYIRDCLRRAKRAQTDIINLEWLYWYGKYKHALFWWQQRYPKAGDVRDYKKMDRRVYSYGPRVARVKKTCKRSASKRN